MTFTPADRALFGRLGIPDDLLVRAQVARVTDREAREVFGVNGYGDRAGICFPYFNPRTGQRWTARLRRDSPETDNGRVRNKYLSAFGDRRHLYFPPDCADLLADATVPVVLVEAEKSVLALTAWAARTGRRLLPVGLGGCYGWRGRIGKVERPDGGRADETGPLPDLDVCNGRRVIIMLDSNVRSNGNVRKASFGLARELAARNATVLLAELPEVDQLNGPDDAIALCGDGTMEEIVDNASLADDVARKQLEAGIRQITAAGGRLSGEERDFYFRLLADVRDAQQREILTTQFARAYRELAKGTIKSEVDRRREEHEQTAAQIAEQARQAALRSLDVRPVELIEQLEVFFAERAYLPEGAALTLAFFALNTWTFDVFDTTPFLNIESAVPGCGKSTVLSLLRVAHVPVAVTALTEATLFRVVHEQRPTLLVDEGEFLEGKSDRAQMIRALANCGYKRGAKVPRCGPAENNFELQWFEVFCPMCFAAIGGLSGTLLERSIVLHMDRRPPGIQLKHSRERLLERDVKALRERCEAYGLQARDQLLQLYDAEPDEGFWPQITDREAELWGPLLIHARLLGPAIEARLFAACVALTKEKLDIQSQELNRALAVELQEAVERVEDERFAPVDLVNDLSGRENWGAKLERFKPDDSKSRAAAVGHFLRRFRFRSRERGRKGSTYLRSEALAVLCLLTSQKTATSATLPPKDGNALENEPGRPEAEKPQTATRSATKLPPAESSQPRDSLGAGQTQTATKSATTVSSQKENTLDARRGSVADVAVFPEV